MVRASSANGAWAAMPPSLRQKLRSTFASSRFRPSSSLIAIGPAGGHRTARSQVASSLGQLVHLGGKLDVQLGHATGIVGGQRDLDVLVDIEPLGMVIHLL